MSGIVLGQKPGADKPAPAPQTSALKNIKLKEAYAKATVSSRSVRRGSELKRRILITGPAGSGKTTFIAEYYVNKLITHPDAKLYMITNDGGFEDVWEEFPVELDKNVVIYEVANFDEEYVAQNEAIELADYARGDIIAVDHLQITWEGAEISYVKNVFGMDLGLYYASVRKQFEERGVKDEGGTTKGATLDGWKDWGTIKQQHNEGYVDKLAQRPPCDFLAATTLEAAKKDKKLYGAMGELGLKPGGEKRNYFRFPTVVYLDLEGGKRTMRIMKNRGKRKGISLAPLPITESVFEAFRLFEAQAVGAKK